MGGMKKSGWPAIAMCFTVASAAIAAGVGPFAIEVFGNFKRMTHSGGDSSGKVRLDDVSGRAATYGIGALADLRGLGDPAEEMNHAGELSNAVSFHQRHRHLDQVDHFSCN